MAKQIASANGLIRTNIFLSVQDKKALAARAKQLNVSAATLTRQALATFLGSKIEPFKETAR
jgi:post-segregation antitoxin (ccd killing protein)